MIGPTIGALLDEIAPLGRADLVRDITSKYPVRVICAIVGVPVEDSAQFHEWAEQINTGPLHPEVGMQASRAMREYLEPLVEERRANPCGDLLSDLVHSEVDGEQLSEERIYGFLRLLLPAGAETTFRVMGHPSIRQRDVYVEDRRQGLEMGPCGGMGRGRERRICQPSAPVGRHEFALNASLWISGGTRCFGAARSEMID
jgi:hypothetical protein